MTVLIADDNDTNRKLHGAIPAGGGYQVLEAANGEEALSAVRSERPDLILMDVKMPCWTASRP